MPSSPRASSETPVPGWRGRVTWRWALVAAYMAAIFVLSSTRGVSLPALLSDKVAHAGLYAGLSALIAWAVTNGDWRRMNATTVLVATAATVLYGWTDEFHQLFVPSRQYEWLDLAADATGAFVAAGALWAWGIIARGNRT